MDAQKPRWRQWLEEAWHGIIGNTAYDVMKRILAVLWLVTGPWLISSGQRALGAAIPAVRDALSTKIVLTVSTISTIVLWFLLGFILAGFVGFASSRILWHWGRVSAIQKSQTISSTTDYSEVSDMTTIAPVLPISDLRYKSKEVLELVKEQPIVLTQRGRPRAVLVDYDTYNEMTRRQQALEEARDAFLQSASPDRP